MKKNKLKLLELKKIMKVYMLLIIPVILIFIFFNSFVYNIQLEKSKEIIISEQKQRAITIEYIVNDILKELNENLFLVRDSDEMSQFVKESNENNKDSLEKMFLRISKNKKNFDQIRFIDNAGNEIIRVNNSGENGVLVEENKLQNKKDMEYYKETSKLKNGEIFISDMNLNVENNKVEKPYKPMIRLATPIYTEQNVYKGILIINYLGDDILEIFAEQFDSLEYNFIEPSLINEEGYYLYNVKDDYNFGFMFEDKKNLTVANEFPDLWENIKLKNEGVVESNDIIRFFMKIEPLKNLKIKSDFNHYWIVISKFDLNSFAYVNNRILFNMNVIDLIILFIILILMFFVLLINFYKTKNKEDLNVILKIADNTNDAMVITDKNTNIIYINKAYEKITGYEKQEIIGSKIGSFKSGLHSREFYKNMWKDINEKNFWNGEIWDKKKNGLFYIKNLSIFKEVEKGISQVRYVGVFNDLTETKEKEKMLNYNKLTNLPNENLLGKLILKSINIEKSKFVLVSFSIVNYNELILECESDFEEYLKDFIRSIKNNIDEKDFIVQLNKNNFILGINGFYNKEEAILFIEKKLSTILEYFKHNMLFNIKIGVSIYPDDTKETKNLLKNVQIALEQSIKTDKKITFYTKELREQINKEIEVTSLLRDAILNNELEIYYQPQVQITGEKTIGAEALIRWKNDRLGNVSPVIFIPLAEKTGQIIEIGYWIIEQVFKDFLLIKDKISSGFRISINISPLQFKDPNLLNKFKEFADIYGIDLNYFEIEITEGIFIQDVENVNLILNKFRKMGLKVAIDDFGTGFSSLSYLKGLNIDKIKIDRSFIKNYPEADDGKIAKVITTMAKELNLDVITEGVENKIQANYINSIGCDLIQGYYYSKPLTIELLIKYLLDKN